MICPSYIGVGSLPSVKLPGRLPWIMRGSFASKIFMSSFCPLWMTISRCNLTIGNYGDSPTSKIFSVNGCALAPADAQNCAWPRTEWHQHQAAKPLTVRFSHDSENRCDSRVGTEIEPWNALWQSLTCYEMLWHYYMSQIGSWETTVWLLHGPARWTQRKRLPRHHREADQAC